jgi:hypothetical protein
VYVHTHSNYGDAGRAKEIKKELGTAVNAPHAKKILPRAILCTRAHRFGSPVLGHYYRYISNSSVLMVCLAMFCTPRDVTMS